MDFNRKEILDALAIIKKVCQNSVDCDDCPLRSRDFESDGCALRIMTPDLWELNIEREKWRAFI